MTAATFQPTLPATMLADFQPRARAWTPPPNSGGPAHAMSVRTAVALEVLKTRMACLERVPCEQMPVDSLVRFAYRVADAMVREA